ncbi:MAG: diaminopimelate epimerase [Alphaproteobacteria bacterium]|nr:diaminopimelate epimerase [Alphaproteobacteria bacterium]MBV9695141.1 diaminopimelate epimerase [Alphaproteobacteria bacterium]
MTAFLKMHGLGNDFVVFDGRGGGFALDGTTARALADRRLGIGCDQVIVIQDGGGAADAAMRIFNADGGEVESCGNAARCVARLLMEEKDRSSVAIDTPGGLLACSDAGHGAVTVDMGAPKFGWRDIPLSQATGDKTPIQLPLDLFFGERNELWAATGTPVSVGNPHFVVPVGNAAATAVYEYGSHLSKHPTFPRGTNVEFFSPLGKDRIRMRVFERGAGVTRACGTGACAAAVVAHLRGMTGRKTEVVLDGGSLWIEWRESDEHIAMTGPASLSFRGDVALEDFAQ